MRDDAIGMFWEDIQAAPGKSNTIRPMPPIPETGWTPPSSYPDLSNARAICIDTETWDPELLTHGPGWARGKGHIVGVSIGVPGGHRWYFPIRHEVEPEMNLDPEVTLRWLRHTLGNPKQPKIGANLMYDVGWLKHEGVEVKGELVDVQFAEALLEESARVSVEQLGQKYLGEGKTTNHLYQWCSDFYGGSNLDQRKNIYRAPPRLVGPYAEGDVDLPLRLAPILYQRLVDEGLFDLFRMECDLIYLLIAMRFAGVRVDVSKAEQLRDSLAEREKIEHKKIRDALGFDVDINSAASLARAFDACGLKYGRTPKGAPSFTKGFLTTVQHPLADGIREIKKLEKLRGTFVESYVLEKNVNGMLYCQFHPLRGDEGGTRSGRFSSSDPNLQNIPSRDDELAPMMRGLFIPDDGHLQWRKYDYSQIEYRFLVHYAIGPGIEEVRQKFRNDPNTDYHVFTQELVKAKTGIELGRKPTKNINFGLVYGMGQAKLMSDLHLSKADGIALFNAYHTGMPFIKPTMEATMAEAERSGVISTILGRKSRFDLWEPTRWDDTAVALPYQQALLKWGSIRRAYLHKALNRRLQGSAADLMKMAMWQCWKDGVFDATGVPRLTVHDELDFSDPGGKDEAFREMRRIMETAIPLKIPVIAEGEVGPDWGHVEEIKEVAA